CTISRLRWRELPACPPWKPATSPRPHLSSRTTATSTPRTASWVRAPHTHTHTTCQSDTHTTCPSERDTHTTCPSDTHTTCQSDTHYSTDDPKRAIIKLALYPQEPTRTFS